MFADVMDAAEASGEGEEEAADALERVAKGLRAVRGHGGIEDLLTAEAWCIEMDQRGPAGVRATVEVELEGVGAAVKALPLVRGAGAYRERQAAERDQLRDDATDFYDVHGARLRGMAKGAKGARRRVLEERAKNMRAARADYWRLQMQALGMVRPAARRRPGIGR